MTAAGFRRGLIAALPFLLSNGAAGLVMGLTYKGLGLGAEHAILFSLLVYSATAQAITLSMWLIRCRSSPWSSPALPRIHDTY